MASARTDYAGMKILAELPCDMPEKCHTPITIRTLQGYPDETRRTRPEPDFENLFDISCDVPLHWTSKLLHGISATSARYANPIVQSMTPWPVNRCLHAYPACAAYPLRCATDHASKHSCSVPSTMRYGPYLKHSCTIPSTMRYGPCFKTFLQRTMRPVAERVLDARGNRTQQPLPLFAINNERERLNSRL